MLLLPPSFILILPPDQLDHPNLADTLPRPLAPPSTVHHHRSSPPDKKPSPPRHLRDTRLPLSPPAPLALMRTAAVPTEPRHLATSLTGLTRRLKRPPSLHAVDGATRGTWLRSEAASTTPHLTRRGPALT